MSAIYEDNLNQIAKQLQKGGVKPQRVTARTFIGWFGAQRRSIGNVGFIRSQLKRHRIVTEPDFEYVYIDHEIGFALAVEKKASNDSGDGEGLIVDVVNDPTYRVGRLASANHVPLSVRPDDPMSKAVTLMMAHDYSQLPVMISEREVKGMITWTSLGGRLALGQGCEHVRDCMIDHREISYDTYIFTAIDDIIKHEYVLIRDSEQRISGIVTTSDLSQQFRQLGEPFLLLGEIENYIRRMVMDKYTVDELRRACDPTDSERNIETVSDLTLGEYLRLIENPDNWDKLAMAIDRGVFVRKLDEIRKIRNDIMHFDPDGIGDEEVSRLREFVKIMQTLARMGVI